MQCPVCEKEQFIGKSLGGGIYNMRAYQGKVYAPGEPIAPHRDENEADAEVLNELYEWMWTHMMECHKDEFKGGELFKVVSEYPPDK
jgi:hypothetical protein